MDVDEGPSDERALAAFDGVRPDTVARLSRFVLANDVEGLRSRAEVMDSLNYNDNRGWTALHWAAYLGRRECVKLLLDKGIFKAKTLCAGLKIRMNILSVIPSKPLTLDFFCS
jgi:hypothetical protein